MASHGVQTPYGNGHPVICLPVHLPDMQSVFFNPDEIEEVRNNAAIRRTQLSEW